MQQNWQTIIAVFLFAFAAIEFVIYKGFGKKAFLLAFVHWFTKLFHASRDIKEMLEGQNLAVTKQNELIFAALVKLEAIENEVRFNGGKYKLVDAIKDILYNQGLYASEREAALYIDAQPIFKTDINGGVTFVNAAWLEMVGCEDADQVMGMSYLIAVPDGDKDFVEKTSERFAKSPAPYHGDFIYKHIKTGELIKTNVRTQLIRDNNGKFVGTLGTVKILN